MNTPGDPDGYCELSNEDGNTIVTPWLYNEPDGDDGLGAAYGIRRVDAERICACVNACEGVHSERLYQFAATARCAEGIRKTMGLAARFPPTAEQLEEFNKLLWGVDIEVRVPYWDTEQNT